MAYGPEALPLLSPYLSRHHHRPARFPVSSYQSGLAHREAARQPGAVRQVCDDADIDIGSHIPVEYIQMVACGSFARDVPSLNFLSLSLVSGLKV